MMFCRQEKTFGLGNFINCTPALKALSDYYEKPFPVLFESVGDAFLNCDFIRHIKKPEGKEVFGSYDINSKVPDWEYVFKEVQSRLGIKLGEIPKSYVDRIATTHKSPYFVVLRGCFSNVPHKVLAKDPGDNIYIQILRYLQQKKALDCIFVGTEDDKTRNEFVFKLMGKYLKWRKTSLREAVGLVNGAEFVIGNDTGLVHTAAALGKNTFCLWHKTNRVKNMARGKVSYSYNNHFSNFIKWTSSLL